MKSVKHFHIVIADDDRDDRDLFAEAVADYHHIVVQNAENGVELMEILNKAVLLPDVIFLDLNMPIKGGKECLKEIRAHIRFNHIPVVIYSTSSSKKDMQETLVLGANLYIPKPNSYDALKKIVSFVLHIDWDDYQPQVSSKKFVLYPQDLDRLSN